LLFNTLLLLAVVVAAATEVAEVAREDIGTQH
jgi:hypothetical protein